MAKNYKTDPKFMKSRLDLLKNQRLQNTVGDIGMFGQFAMGLGNLLQARRQIKAANKGLSQLQAPGVPTPPRRSESLANALRMAQRDSLNAANTINPAKLGILDQYTKDLANAKTASTGQAGTFGALAQVAALRRNRGEAGLAGAVSQAEEAAANRQAGLMQQRNWEKINDFNWRNDLYKTGLRQYNTEAGALGNLMSTGYQNQNNALNSLVGQLPGLVSAAGGLNIQMPWVNDMGMAQPLSAPKLPRSAAFPEVRDMMDSTSSDLEDFYRNIRTA